MTKMFNIKIAYRMSSSFFHMNQTLPVAIGGSFNTYSTNLYQENWSEISLNITGYTWVHMTVPCITHSEILEEEFF